MRSDNKMGEDLKAVAEDVMQLGARCVQAGRAWLNERRNEMTDRNEDYRSDNGNRSSYQSRQGAGQPRAQASRGRQQGYQQGQQGYQQGSYQQPQGSSYQSPGQQQYGQQGGYQQGEYQQGSFQQPQAGYQGSQQGWQQGRSQYQPQYQQGSQAQSGRHGAEEFASQDYGRAQAWGQGGMEREYGQSFEQGLGQTSMGQGPYGDDDFGYGARAQSGWQQQRGSQSQQYGMPRQDSRQEPRQDYQGSGRGAYAQQGYSGYQARGPGEGYGNSSGYGNPDQDRYGSHNYSGESFISPADTQLVHSGRGRQSYARPDYGSDFGTSGYGMGYSGVGPRNYTRSDERITEDLCERLTHDHDIDASDIEVKVANGTATLEGTVSQRWMKHRVEDMADNCSGVRNVDNRLRVQSQSESASHAGSSRDGGSSTRASGGSQTGSPTTPTSGSTGTAH